MSTVTISTPRPNSAHRPYVEARQAGWLCICPSCHTRRLWGLLADARHDAETHLCDEEERITLFFYVNPIDTEKYGTEALVAVAEIARIQSYFCDMDKQLHPILVLKTGERIACDSPDFGQLYELLQERHIISKYAKE